ncbi:hypothetical protein BHE74_00032791, partial [Ensete ventricosum]
PEQDREGESTKAEEPERAELPPAGAPQIRGSGGIHGPGSRYHGHRHGGGDGEDSGAGRHLPPQPVPRSFVFLTARHGRGEGREGLQRTGPRVAPSPSIGGEGKPRRAKDEELCEI